MSPKRASGWEGRDGKERERERLDLAFKLAKAMQEKKRREFEKKGLSKDDIKDRLPSIGELADFLHKMNRKELDKMLDEQKRALGQSVRKSKKELGSFGDRTASEIKNAGSRFKEYLQGKHDLRNRKRERNDTKSSGASDSGRKEPSSKKDSRRSPARRESKKKNLSDSKTPVSFKDIFKGVRELQDEKAKVSREKNQSHRTCLENKSKKMKNPERLRENVDTSNIWKIRSNEQLNESLDAHWKIITSSNFDKRYKQATIYCTLMEGLDNQTIPRTPETYRRFAEENGIHRTTVPRWTEEVMKPPLINQLENLRKLEVNNNNKTISEPASPIESTERPRVIFSSEPIKKVDWVPKGESDNYQFLPATVGDRQYLWVKEKNSLLEAYDDQYVYFRRMQDIDRIFEQAASNLKLDTMVEAVHHIQHLTKHYTKRQLEFITNDNPRINASSLHMLCDTAGLSIHQLQARIEKIAGANGQGGIENPRFPKGSHLEVLKARLIGIAVSDCHLPKSGTMSLYEANLDRINRVKQLLDNFGTTYNSDSLVKRKGDYAFYIASPMLSALENWGIPTGDRTIQNYGLPYESKEWSNLAIQGYFREMLAQEGNVDKNGVINWSRSHTLYDGKKGEKYNFQSKLSQDALTYLRESKKMRKYSGMVSETSIPIGRLEKLSSNQNEHVSNIAKEILSIVHEYRNRLIDDERQLIQRLGIDINLDPVRVSYFPASDRVSVRWQARIPGKLSKIRCALLISPNHEMKEKPLQAWLEKQTIRDIKRSKKQIESDGFGELLF